MHLRVARIGIELDGDSCDAGRKRAVHASCLSEIGCKGTSTAFYGDWLEISW
ncbi:hypothetical protein BRADI_1g08415v3 [Brachypodium distachyon]|uniref:Uncharacterized protein n=1 Tax=Brachypodium distachyon TaxID=15368 RepID=A0A2K2DIM9_BRADI|nr:hypothetical protein BRADI_1g08415v3 [Brachypodium distachyon]